MGEYLQKLGQAKISQNPESNTQKITDKLDFFKTKKLDISKKNYLKSEQVSKQKIIAIHVSDIGHIPRTQKCFLQVNNLKNNIAKKWTKDLNSDFTRENIQND